MKDRLREQCKKFMTNIITTGEDKEHRRDNI